MKGRVYLWIAGIVFMSPGVVRAQSAPAAPAAAGRKLQVDDYFRIRDVDDPQISPEGKWVAYTVTTKDLKGDENHDRIWMTPTAGGTAIPVSADGVDSSSPRWSPDRKYLAFLSERNEKPKQVWLLDRNGGNLPAFYAAVRKLGADPAARRALCRDATATDAATRSSLDTTTAESRL